MSDENGILQKLRVLMHLDEAERARVELAMSRGEKLRVNCASSLVSFEGIPTEIVDRPPSEKTELVLIGRLIPSAAK